MRKISILWWPLILLSSCQWLLLHPEILPEAEEVGEEVVKDVQEYEHSRTLSPGPQLPSGTPPMKLHGATGP